MKVKIDILLNTASTGIQSPQKVSVARSLVDLCFVGAGFYFYSYVNTANNLFLRAGKLSDDYFSGYICLDKEDVKEIISMLKNYLKQM